MGKHDYQSRRRYGTQCLAIVIANENGRLYCCNVCHYSAMSQRQFREHARCHMFQCDMCSTCDVQLNSVLVHRNRAHPHSGVIFSRLSVDELFDDEQDAPADAFGDAAAQDSACCPGAVSADDSAAKALLGDKSDCIVSCDELTVLPENSASGDYFCPAAFYCFGRPTPVTHGGGAPQSSPRTRRSSHGGSGEGATSKSSAEGPMNLARRSARRPCPKRPAYSSLDYPVDSGSGDEHALLRLGSGYDDRSPSSTRRWRHSHPGKRAKVDEPAIYPRVCSCCSYASDEATDMAKHWSELPEHMKSPCVVLKDISKSVDCTSFCQPTADGAAACGEVRTSMGLADKCAALLPDQSNGSEAGDSCVEQISSQAVSLIGSVGWTVATTHSASPRGSAAPISTMAGLPASIALTEFPCVVANVPLGSSGNACESTLNADVAPVGDSITPLNDVLMPLDAEIASLKGCAPMHIAAGAALFDIEAPVDATAGLLQASAASWDTSSVPDACMYSMAVSVSPFEASPVKLGVSPMKLDVSPVKLDASPLKLDASPVKLDASPLKLDASPLKLDASPVKLDASPVKLVQLETTQTTPLLGAAPVKLDAGPTVPNASPTKTDTFPVKLDGVPAKPDASFMESSDGRNTQYNGAVSWKPNPASPSGDAIPAGLDADHVPTDAVSANVDDAVPLTVDAMLAQLDAASDITLAITDKTEAVPVKMESTPTKTMASSLWS